MKSQTASRVPWPSLALLWFFVAAFSACALFAEFFVSAFFFFSPGWANGWPFGLSFQLALAIGVTIWCAVMLMTAAAGLGAIIGFVCALFRLGEKRGIRVYCIWLGVAAAITLVVSIGIFASTYTDALKAFPDGYQLT
jgi:hypothetical protein